MEEQIEKVCRLIGIYFLMSLALHPLGCLEAVYLPGGYLHFVPVALRSGSTLTFTAVTGPRS